MRAGSLARAHTRALPRWTLPLWTPCVSWGGGDDRTWGDRTQAAAVVETAPIRKRRRLSTPTSYRNR
jgi:hypothetical protein